MSAIAKIDVIPSCAFGVTPANYNGDAANRFDLRSAKYYKVHLSSFILSTGMARDKTGSAIWIH